MRYEIEHARRPGSFVIHGGDIKGIRSRGGAVEITLVNRYEYQRYIEEAGWRETSDDQHLILSLTAEQVASMVEQHRSANHAFCRGSGSDNCYDYGKSSAPPPRCQRCQLLSACQKAKLGDYRKVRPVQAPTSPAPIGMTIGMLILIAGLQAALWNAALTHVDNDSLRQSLSACRQQKPLLTRIGER